MASDELRNAVMQAVPLSTGIEVSKPMPAAVGENIQPVNEDLEALPGEFLSNKTGLDLLGDSLQRHIEIERQDNNDSLKEECRAKCNTSIDKSLIESILSL